MITTPIMNSGSISSRELETCLALLGRALIHIRAACGAGHVEKAEALADAFHNLPQFLAAVGPPDWTLRTFDELFLAGLVERYPEFEGMRSLLHESMSASPSEA